MVWNLFSTAERLAHGQSMLHTDLVFWPLDSNLATHSLASGFAPLALLVRWLVDPDTYPVVAFSLAVFACFTLNVFFSFLALRTLGFGIAAAFIPVLSVVFSSFSVIHLYHLNLNSTFIIPLNALMLARLLRKPTQGRAVAAAVCLSAAIYFSELIIFFDLAIAATAVWLAVRARSRPMVLSVPARLGPGGVAMAALAFAAVAAPFAAAWLKSAALPPNLDEAGTYSANLIGFFVPHFPRDLTYGTAFAGLNQGLAGIPGYETFLGYPFIILALAGAIVGRRNTPVAGASVVGAVFLVLSLGPTLKVGAADWGVSLPYAWLAGVPPFNMGRTPVRLVVPAQYALMVPAAYGARLLLTACGRLATRRAVLAFLALAFLAVWTVLEIRQPAVAKFPVSVPATLDRVRGPVLMLPVVYADGLGLLYQMHHRQPISSGYLARVSTGQQKQLAWLDGLSHRSPQSVCEEGFAAGFRTVLLGAVVPDLALYDTQCALEVVRAWRRPPARLLVAWGELERQGMAWDTPGVRILRPGAAHHLRLTQPDVLAGIDLLANGPATLRLVFLHQGVRVGTIEVPPVPWPGLRWRALTVPPVGVVDDIAIEPGDGLDITSIGRIEAWTR